jgi:hypothetical protein
MKVYAHHDASGAIHGLVVVDAPEERTPMLAPRPGHFVGEIEGRVPGWKHKPGQPGLEALRKVAENLRVDTPIGRCKLVRKKKAPR